MSLHATLAARETLTLGAPRLYREELESIARIIEGECDFFRIDFHDDRGRVSDSSAGFVDYYAQVGAGELLERLTISGSRGDLKITVSFAPSGSLVELTNPDNSARGAANQIRSLCRENKRISSSFMESGVAKVFLGLAMVAVVWVVFVGALGITGDNHFASTILTVSLIAGILPDSGLVSVPSGRAALINAPRSERPPWLKRHGKDVFLLFVGGCVGYGVNQIPEAVHLFGG